MGRLAPFESSWAKYRHAVDHVDCLKAELDRVMDDKKRPFRVKNQIEPDKIIVRVTHLPDFGEAGLIFGDAISDFRAALDHLTWDLVKLGTHPRLTPQQAKQVQFPLVDTAPAFREPRHRTRRAPGITDEQWRVMGLYQPYKHGQRGRAMRFLRQISDMEKHRRITPTVTSATAHHGVLSASGCTITDVTAFPPKRALYVGAKLFTIAVNPIDLEYDVYADTDVALRPSIGRSVAIMEVADLVRDTVREILTAYAPLI